MNSKLQPLVGVSKTTRLFSPQPHEHVQQLATLVNGKPKDFADSFLEDGNLQRSTQKYTKIRTALLAFLLPRRVSSEHRSQTQRFLKQRRLFPFCLT